MPSISSDTAVYLPQPGAGTVDGIAHSLQVVHDLQTFLSVICMAAQAAGQLAPEGRPPGEYLAAIEDNARHANDLCLEMRAVLSNQRAESRRSIVDLNELVRGTAPLLETLMPRGSIVHYELAHGLPALAANPAQLREALLALATNAADSLAERSGCLLIRTRHEREGHPAAELSSEDGNDARDTLEGVVLEVCDTGCGLDAATLARICTSSFTTKRHGSGLGWASVRRIVHNHGGSVTIDTEVGLGTTVSCFLPLRTERARLDS